MLTKDQIKETIHSILQEELADRAIYQDRLAEETLRRGLQSAESRLNTAFAHLSAQYEKLIEEALPVKKNIRGVVVEQDMKNWGFNAALATIRTSLQERGIIN